MGSNPMQTKVKIRETTWTVKVMSNASYVRKFERGTEATTDDDDKTIYINRNFLNPNTVIHELVHALVFESHTISSNLDALQTEELIAQLMGEYLSQIQDWTNKILNELLRKESK